MSKNMLCVPCCDSSWRCFIRDEKWKPCDKCRPKVEELRKQIREQEEALEWRGQGRRNL